MARCDGLATAGGRSATAIGARTVAGGGMGEDTMRSHASRAATQSVHRTSGVALGGLGQRTLVHLRFGPQIGCVGRGGLRDNLPCVGIRWNTGSFGFLPQRKRTRVSGTQRPVRLRHKRM